MPNTSIVNPSLEMNTDTATHVEILPSHKEAFLKSILTDAPYEETLELFDGQIKAKFRSMTVQENNDVVNQVVLDRDAGTASDNDAYFITISTYRLALSLVSIDNKPFSEITKETYTPTDEKDSYVLAKAKPMTSWATPKLSIYLDAFRQFEGRVLKLTNEVQTPNFWKASA